MRPPHAPSLDERRAPQFSAELEARARAWISGWGLADGEHDFGRALLEIAARFNSEVAERLDDAGEKMRRGFLDWLAVQGEAARPARIPVVFKLADAAQEGVSASAPVRMQADAAGTPVVFETEKDVRIVPGRLDVVVGVDAASDAYYLPPPALSDLSLLESLPTEWRIKNFAAAGTTKLQLDPELGLKVEMLIEANGAQYTVREVDNGLVTIDRPLETDLTDKDRISKVTTFIPFDSTAYNWQQHSLYLGDSELLNIDAEAKIDVVGATGLMEGVTWEYWGKADDKDEVKWQRLEPDPDRQKKTTDAVALKKPKGAIEQREINGKGSRWIRGTITQLVVQDQTLKVDALSLRINYMPGDLSCHKSETAASSPTAEAMANNTPLVLSEPFYPLGREPHQFDAFYLGCKEAFSKKGATALVCLEMSDSTCQAYAVVGAGQSANKVLAGVGKDRALHLFKLNAGVMTRLRGPLRPPRPLEPGIKEDQTVSLDLNPRCRPVIWSGTAPNADDYYVAVAAGGGIWIWHEKAGNENQNGWKRHSTVPGIANTPAEIEDIIVLASAPDRPGAVLSSGRFWVFDGSDWIQPLAAALPNYAALAPVHDKDFRVTDLMVAVSLLGTLYQLDRSGTAVAIPLLGVEVDIGAGADGNKLPGGTIRPAAITHGSNLDVVAVGKDRGKLVAVRKGSTPHEVSLGDDVKAIGGEVTASRVSGQMQFFVGAKKTAVGGAIVASWVPIFDASVPPAVSESTIPDASGDIGGTPLVVGDYVVVPGGRGDAFVARFDLLNITVTTVIGEGIKLQGPPPFAIGDFISVMPKNSPRMEWKVTRNPSGRGLDFIYMIDPPLGKSVSVDPELFSYRATDNRSGEKTSPRYFKVDPLDPEIVADQILRITVDPAIEPAVFCKVVSVNLQSLKIKVDTTLPGNNGDTLLYWKPIPFAPLTSPVVRPSIKGDPNWNASTLDNANFDFPVTLQPSRQRALSFGVIDNHPAVVVLADRWTSQPPSLTTQTEFIINSTILDWRHQLTDSTSNPALSWEYWNGKGWWSLNVSDGTERLASSGAVRFDVPPDIGESDWAGKTNFWIRARLVGGDYGREEVKVITKPRDPPKPGETEQTIERSTANIRAPLVLDVHISYSVCNPVRPAFVLAQDSGTIRDQSDANRTDGAIVEAFVPLAVMLKRLTNSVVSPELSKETPSDCGCQAEQPPDSATQKVAPAAATTPTSDNGRSLYIGLDATLSESPVNLLLLVDEENPNTNFAPMRIEALVADRFVPIVADDATRALGESGVLSLSFPIPPSRSELFGKENLTWLRLIPKSPSDKWFLTLRGAYLNAVWASATETLTRELLGSSDGSPNLTVRLARPPVLHKTLKLRVKEPLGEEERKLLLGNDAKIDDDAKGVLSNIDGLPGDWVLWRQVIDPDDEDATERVYALDESNGEIRFGDGQHGRIPPIGRDSIVAFRYCRTEPDPTGGDSVPANTIAARTTLNLVSPVESVESVIAADPAAGGAPPESDDRVLRFGFARLRHRNRAVTAIDLEDLALQSSPDIVQARAFVRRGYIRLVVVMRGKNPRPNAAQVRELRRLLLAAAPATLSAPNALRIDGPEIRKLRIELTLRVETLDHTGQLSAFVKKKLADYFDTAAGGADKDGWPLGANPSQDDIAYAISDAPFLEAIEDVKLREVTADGKELPSLETVGSREIVMLADDPIRIVFETAEVTV